jgi:trehalose 6-phosphate synthase
MPPDEQERRMRRMRQQIEEQNVYRWAGSLLCEMIRLADRRHSAGDAA